MGDLEDRLDHFTETFRQELAVLADGKLDRNDIRAVFNLVSGVAGLFAAVAVVLQQMGVI